MDYVVELSWQTREFPYMYQSYPHWYLLSVHRWVHHPEQSLHFSRHKCCPYIPVPPTSHQQPDQSVYFSPQYYLYKESKDITINLSLLNQTSTKVVRSSPFAEITNGLRVQTDALSANFVQLIISKGNFGRVNGRWEDAEFGLRSHLEGASAVWSGNWLGYGTCSLGDDEIGAWGWI